MPCFRVIVEYSKPRTVSQGRAAIQQSNHYVQASCESEAVEITRRHRISYPRWVNDVTSRVAFPDRRSGPLGSRLPMWIEDGDGRLHRG